MVNLVIFLKTEACGQTAQFSLHSHSSKNRSPDSFPGVKPMGPIFGVVSLGTHRYHPEVLQPDLKAFWKWCHPSKRKRSQY